MNWKRPRHRRALALLTVAGLVGALGAVGSTDAFATTDATATVGALVSAANGKCLDVTEGATADGTRPQMWSCATGARQTWTLGADGTVRSLGKCLDVADNGTGDGAVVHLWTCLDAVASQKWQLTAGRDLVNVAANKCLDIVDGNPADGALLQLWTCAGTANQKWTLGPGATSPTPAPTPVPPNAANPDLGPNVFVFDPSMSDAAIQSRLTAVFRQQETNQFGGQRYALLFKPGSYDVDANVGFYTSVAGLGLTPDAVSINGHVHAEADWFPDGSHNATQNFWRSAENLSVTPGDGQDRWAVAQASPYRRMHVRGDLALSDGGWASGGFIADSRVDGQIQSGTQQQFLTRDSQLGSWTGSRWNQVFVGVAGAPPDAFPNPAWTTVGAAPVVREKPFLYVDSTGAYRVFVPALRSNAAGVSWGATPAGESQPISRYAVIRPGDTATTMNAALAAGKNLLITPGVYHLDRTVAVTRADTVVLGLGMATLIPDDGITALTVADVDGVKLAGLLVDAGPVNSPVLAEIGPVGSSARHAADPTSLSDVFFRVGGAGVGRATVSLRINSDDVIGDHSWIWRADHGGGVGWTTNTARNGLVVDGDNVTFYGLFVEHYQQYQTIWNGNNGRTYFYQNEMPYDPPDQAAFQHDGVRGWAAYKVADSVSTHQAWGLGSYCYFSTNPAVVAGRAFEVPAAPGVRFHHLVTVSLGGVGTISHVINDAGAAANGGNQVSYLGEGP